MAAGESPVCNASRMVSWFVLKGLCSPHKLFGTFLISPLSAHCLKPYFHRMQPRREGNFKFNFSFQ